MLDNPKTLGYTTTIPINQVNYNIKGGQRTVKKGKRKDDNFTLTLKVIVFITAILNFIEAVFKLVEHLIN